MSIELNISGMSCGHCQQAVERALKSVPGVKTAEVSLETQKAFVEGACTVEQLINAVAEEGYGATTAG